jgi:hypothetical protein
MNQNLEMFIKATIPIISIEQGVKGMSQAMVTFDNGYKASVINDGYGKEDGLYEIAILDSSDNIDYTTPITDDVLGHLTEADVLKYLKQISELPNE